MADRADPETSGVLAHAAGGFAADGAGEAAGGVGHAQGLGEGGAVEVDGGLDQPAQGVGGGAAAAPGGRADQCAGEGGGPPPGADREVEESPAAEAGGGGEAVLAGVGRRADLRGEDEFEAGPGGGEVEVVRGEDPEVHGAEPVA